MSCTKTNSNLSKNPFSSTNHNGSYHKGSLISLTQKLTAFYTNILDDTEQSTLQKCRGKKPSNV